MNNVNLNDQEFLNSNSYINFLKENPGIGYLKVRAYSANQAIPIKGLKILVNKKINGYNVNFFEGYTNESGIIEKISLPAPKIDSNDLIAPKSTNYELIALVNDNNLIYNIRIYDKLNVVQNISVVPNMGDN